MKTTKTSRKVGAKEMFRPVCTFAWNDQEVTLLVNNKSGQAAFEIDGKRVEDPELQDELSKHFTQINRHDH